MGKKSKGLMNDSYFSSYPKNCSGYLDNPNGNYVVLPYLGVASIKKEGLPKQLEEIVAFDAAQGSFANAGKINAITVSSFIGPKGRLAGYDFFSGDDVIIGNMGDVKICSLEPLLNVTSSILGYGDNIGYPLFPGSMVPCALKSFYSDKEGSSIYSGVSISVPKDRIKNPFLLMEDVGFSDFDISGYPNKIVKSSLDVCATQNIEVDKIYVARKDVSIGKGEVGSSLVMCLYVHLPNDLKNKILGEFF